MAKHKRLGYALSAAAMVGSSFLPFASVSATDVSDKLVYNDAASGLSDIDITYENGVTSLDVVVRFDGASIDKVLNQASGVGSVPGSFYASVDPKYGFTTPFGKGNYNYTPGVDEPTTPEEFEQGFADQIDECSEYYQRWYGPSFSCDSWAYWSSSSSAFWQDYGYIQYKKDGNWITAPSDQTNFATPTQASDIRSNRDRLVAALGLESADELEYGVNWRFVGDETATAWIYRDTKAATYPVSNQDEYIKIHTTVEYVFDYMTLDANGNPIYHETLQDALDSEDATVILNKDTVVDTITIPAGKTLIEREGKLTINDTLHSSILGTYTKQDGENYHIVKLTQNNQQGNDVTMKTGLVQVDDVVDIDYAILDGFKYASTLNGEAYAEDVFVMPNADVSFVVTYSEWTITVGADEGDDSASDTVRAAIAASVTEDLKALIADGETENENLSLNDLEATKDVYKAGGQLEEYYEEWLYPSSDYYEGAEAYDKIVAAMEDGEQIAAMYDGLIDLYYGNSHYGAVYGLNTPVEVRFNIPEEFRNAPAGYGRIFTIIRGHIDMNGNESATRLETSVDGTDAVAMNDKFSSFAIVYKDVPANPDTGVITRQGGSATIASAFAAGFVGLLASITSFAYLIKRRKN